MKAISIVFAFVFCMLMSSCDQKVTTVTNTKTSFSTEPTGSFFVAKQIVKKGDTVWAYSKDHYGIGTKWRDIVAQNPFLNEPGRVYFDTALGKWIVVIKPGEELKIGGEVINPVFVVEEETKTITTESAFPLIPWWGWLTMFAVAALIIWLFLYGRPNFLSNNANPNATATANANVHVDLRGTDNFDAATERAIRAQMIERNQRLKEDIWYDSYRILQASSDNNRLQDFTVDQGEAGIFVNANFRRDRESKNEPKNEDKKES